MTTPLRIWHPFTNSLLDPPPLPVASAEGVYLHLADGRRILDAISSWWVNLHGHAHPRISDAVAQQAHKLEHVLLAASRTNPSKNSPRACANGYRLNSRTCFFPMTVPPPLKWR